MRLGPTLVTLTLLLVVAVAAAAQTRPADADFNAVMSAAFERAVGFDPFDEERLELVRRQEGEVRAAPGFAETVAAGRRAVADPTDRALRRELDVRLGRLVQVSGSKNVMALLYFVFKEAVLEQQEDKEYWLSKLKERNALAESLAEYLHQLDEATGALTRGENSGHGLRHELTVVQVEPAPSQARPGGQVRQTPLKLVPGRLSRVIEGEALAPTAVASAGSVEVQPMQGFGGQWSGSAQLFWRPPAPVDKPIRNWPNLRLRFEVGAKQTYELTLVHTVAPDYGKLRVFLDGQIVTDVDGWAPQVDVRERALGEKVLAAGSHEMILTVFDRNPASQGWYVGVDALRLTAAGKPAGQSSPGAMKPRPQPEVGEVALDAPAELATIRVGDRWFYLLPDGKNLEVILYDNGPDYFAEGLVRGLRDGRIGYWNERLEPVVAARYDWGWPFEGGLALVCSGCRQERRPGEEHTSRVGGSWGVIDAQGNEVIALGEDREAVIAELEERRAAEGTVQRKE